MTEKGRRDFCIECRKETEYFLQKKDIVKNIRDKEYTFAITVAVCAECGEEMSIPGLIDKNVQEIDEQYRAAEGLVSIDDIERLMKIYKIGKAPSVPGAWVWRGDDSEISGRAGAFQRVFGYHENSAFIAGVLEAEAYGEP